MNEVPEKTPVVMPPHGTENLGRRRSGAGCANGGTGPGFTQAGDQLPVTSRGSIELRRSLLMFPASSI